MIMVMMMMMIIIINIVLQQILNLCAYAVSK